jgi:hypothetical protein
VIALIGRADLLTDLNQTQSRIEISEEIVGLADDSVVFVAQPEVQRQPLGDAPIILKENPFRPVAHASGGVSDEDVRRERHVPPGETCEEILQGG